MAFFVFTPHGIFRIMVVLHWGVNVHIRQFFSRNSYHKGDMQDMGYILELRKVVGTKPLLLVGACVLVFNEEGYLLLQKRTDTLDWGTIGGAMELGESMEEAAHRELYEETELRAGGMKFITLLSGADMYFQYPHGDEVYNVIAVYEALDASCCLQ